MKIVLPHIKVLTNLSYVEETFRGFNSIISYSHWTSYQIKNDMIGHIDSDFYPLTSQDYIVFARDKVYSTMT